MVTGDVVTGVLGVAARSPGAEALVDRDRVVTYAELCGSADATARALRAAGAGPGQVVALLTGRGADFVVGGLGTMVAGAAYLPLDLANPLERQRLVVEDTGPVVAVVSDETAGLGEQLGLPEVRVRRALAPPDEPWAVPSPDAPAYLVATSGSTGRPKGVVVGHRSLANLGAWHQQAYAVTSATRVLHTAGLGFDAAVWELWPNLTAGACVAVCPDELRFTAEDIAEQVTSHGCSLAFVSTSLVEEMLAEAVVPPGLEHLLTGGDLLRLSGAVPEGTTLVNHYGPTEATVVTSAHTVTEREKGAVPPIGSPISGAEVLVLDPDGQKVADGEEGELLVGGAVLALGYHGRPDLTADSFVELPGHDGRWYRTRDLVVSRDGVLHFAGRVDREQLKVRGLRVEASDIEAALVSLPGVRSAAVTTVGRGIDCQLVALVSASAPLDLAAARETLLERLPRGLLPNRFLYGDQLPLTPNGKVDRTAIDELVAEQLRDAAGD